MKTILIIEDDISIARLIKTYVSFAGYEAAIAPDGELALVMLGEEKYNLVILDLMLPHVDGEMVLETIKKLRLPVIVVSAKSSLVDRVRLLRAGADDYITKPFESA
ncbi:response regulator, partial [Enterocloster asparagiformis]